MLSLLFPSLPSDVSFWAVVEVSRTTDSAAESGKEVSSGEMLS